MKYLKLYESIEDVKFTEHKQNTQNYIKDNFGLDYFDFIDEFIGIEDMLVDVDIQFIVIFKNRDKYPKNCHFDIVRNNGTISSNVYQTQLIHRRTMYEKQFEYGISYHGYPYIKKDDIVDKYINILFINQRNPSTISGENLHFLDKFKKVISEVCRKYQLYIRAGEKSNMEKIGYTSYNISLGVRSW